MATTKNGQKKRLWDFKPVSKQEWEEQITTDLKGADYKKRLFWDPHEGFSAAPFYIREDLKNLNHDVTRPLFSSPGWTCCEPLYETTAKQANKAIKKALHSGTDSFLMEVKSSRKTDEPGGDLHGIQIQKQVDFNQLLDGFDDDKVEFTFDSGMSTPAIVAMLKNHPNELKNARFIFDPFSYIAANGRLPVTMKALSQIVNELADQKGMKTLCADGLFYHKNGASIVQELALTLATLSEYLSLIDADKKQSAANALFVRLGAGPLYFPEIAKFRALRLLWDQLMKAYGLEHPPKVDVIAETTPINKTITDRHNNLIRTITESMSAVLGGVNQLLVHPFDAIESTPGEFSRRIARNIQHILRDESHFDKVADPSAGSYYIENLTSSIARESWEYFQSIEKEGGLLQSLKSGSVQQAINQSKEAREDAVNKGKKVLVGTSYYANPDEDLPEPIKPASYSDTLELTGFEFKPNGNLIKSLQKAFKKDATVGDVIDSILNPQKTRYQTVDETKMGAAFDEIRLRTKSLSKETGMTPTIHLVPVGDPKWRNARAGFSHNTLGSGGFVIDHPNGYASIEEAAETIPADNAEAYVLCSSDAEYPELVEPFCNSFSGRGFCILAGHPGDYEKTYRDAGIDLFIYKGMNVPAALLEIQNHVFETEEES